jgi:hypothetical protein
VKRAHLVLTLLTIGAFLTVSPKHFRLWAVQSGRIEAAATPIDFWHLLEPETLSNYDYGSPNQCIRFTENELEIAICDEDKPAPVWSTPDHWTVTEAMVADLNRDGLNELALVVWRPHQPWPVDAFLPHGGRIADFQNAAGLSCHVILIGWDGDEYRELWAGSALIDPVSHIRAADVDGDGFQELIALEGSYESTQDKGNLTIWDWNGFGFRLRDRAYGNYSDLAIVTIKDNILVLTN